MKKILIVLPIILLNIQLTYSQVLISLLFGDKLNSEKLEFGLDGGFNFSSMSDFESSKTLSTFNLGFYFDILLKNQWYVNTGVLVKSNVGLNKLTEDDVAILDPDGSYLEFGTYSQRISYFHVPVTIKYRFKNHFFINAGPQVALRTKAQLKFEGEENNKAIEVNTDNRDLFTRLEAGIIAGVGYKLKKGKGMNVGIKYMYGLTDVLKDDQYTSRNRSFYLSVGIPIGRGKAMERQDASKKEN
jgi:hypothetical protein